MLPSLSGTSSEWRMPPNSMMTALIPFALVSVKAFTVSPEGALPHSLVSTERPAPTGSDSTGLSSEVFDSTGGESPDSVELEQPTMLSRQSVSSPRDLDMEDFIVVTP